MTKEEKIKELLDKYEEEGLELAHKYDEKTNELPDPFDESLTDEEYNNSIKKQREIMSWYEQELQAREQRFIRAIAALEG